MNHTKNSSVLLDKAVEEFSQLPGIGKQTALRLALHLLKKGESTMTRFGQTFIEMGTNIQKCKICQNISDTEVCSICSDSERDIKTICIVENIRDVLSIENTNQFSGRYHVLGGTISPMDGIGPSDLEIDTLISRVQNEPIQEIILALSTTMEGDTTNFFLFKKLNQYDIKISVLARGVSVGDELYYTDTVTLGKSIANRATFDPSF
ncbi:recombination mediator RecR [Halosquirtibacter laminarini]|uniref:Recombination mediator RecR n=1 Tax=Halosquirtibacter laminarini TaxID=3374600 RepID=A0AC61NPM8_9BACT|nr:recombination mediator RecR [Prolixibacteraceae bacterium]